MGAERHLSRRRLLQRGGGGLAVAAAGVRPVAAQPATPPPAVATPMGTGTGLADAALPQFEADVAAALSAFRIVGAAVALVDRRGIRFQRGFGVRDVAGGGPVTPETHFFVASTTKSMSATLVASFVDDGAFAWDQPVREVWPDFRAPTPELTESLRVRDLLGMATGIGEPPAVSSFHEGDPTAGDLLRSLATLPVIAPPQTEYFYNNTVYAAGGYLPALVQGTPENALETAYVRLLTERVYRPAGMATARITDDPRPYVTDYATGHAFEFQHGTTAVPFAPVGSYAPVGGTLASLADLSAYVATQLNAGVSPLGRRVVSAANLAECWKPHIALPRAGSLDPDREQAGYGMGWISQTYRGGRRLVWHNGGIDGFRSVMAFLPEHGIGFVVLANWIELDVEDLQYDLLEDIASVKLEPRVAQTVPELPSAVNRWGSTFTTCDDASYDSLFTKSFKSAVPREKYAELCKAQGAELGTCTISETQKVKGPYDADYFMKCTKGPQIKVSASIVQEDGATRFNGLRFAKRTPPSAAVLEAARKALETNEKIKTNNGTCRLAPGAATALGDLPLECDKRKGVELHIELDENGKVREVEAHVNRRGGRCI